MDSTVPSTAKRHSWSWIAAYSWPPMNVSASAAEQPGGHRADDAERRHRADAAQQGRAPGRLGRHRRERDHDHELGEEQHRLHQDQATGVQAGLVGVEHAAGDDHVGVGEGEEGQQGVRVARGLAEHRPAAVPAVRVRHVTRARVPQGQPADDRRREEPDRHTHHGPELGRAPQQQGDADHQPRRHRPRGRRGPGRSTVVRPGGCRPGRPSPSSAARPAPPGTRSPGCRGAAPR